MAQARGVRDGHEVSGLLEEIAALLALSEENPFKVQAYQNGAQVVAGLGNELARLIAEDRLTEIEGIGAGIAKQIVELWQAGASPLLVQLRGQHFPGAAELMRVPGLTPRRIRALHAGLGIASIEQLRSACREQRVRTLPGFGAKTEQRLLEAVERSHTATAEERRILLGHALRVAERLEQELVGSGAASRMEVAGAVRRFEEIVSELAVVVVGDEARIWDALARSSLLIRVDRERRTAQLMQGVPLIVDVTSSAGLGACLSFATGPEPHLRMLQARAHARGLQLSAAGLATAAGVPLALADEVALYRALELPFVPPELRAEQLDAGAHDHADLLAQDDIAGAIHCHTTYSDGRNSIEEMALAAQALGMRYITITDHSPSAHYARGVSLDRLREQWDEIARVQERVQIRILRGTESDILADGSLDHPADVIEQLDVVIASIHSRFKLGREQMTQRLVRAMEQPVFKIWGHALGRMLLARDPVDCDVPAVLDALARSRGAIELNADPHRLDLPPVWIPAARARGIPFVVSVDAHSTEGLRVLPLGVGMARRGGLRRDEVLNTLPAAEFAARVHP